MTGVFFFIFSLGDGLESVLAIMLFSLFHHRSSFDLQQGCDPNKPVQKEKAFFKFDRKHIKSIEYMYAHLCNQLLCIYYDMVPKLCHDMI